MLEGTELYSELQEAVFAYAESKGHLASRRSALEKLYAKVENADIDAELTADLVGDYLFTDADFVRQLHAGNRNVFQKVFDEIQYMLKLATAGSKEARQLEKAKKVFEQVYREAKAEKNTAKDGGVRYSMSQSRKKVGYVDQSSVGGYDFTKSFAEQIDDYKRGIFPEKDTFLVGRTPEVLTKIGLANIPLTMNQTHMDYSLNGTYKGDPERVKDHILTAEEMAKVPELIADPVAIIQDRQLCEKKARGFSVDVLVSMEINGKKTLIPININSRGQINGVEIDSNRIQTIHENTDTVQRLINALNEDSADNAAVFYINKEKAAEFLRPAGNPISRAAQELDGFIHSITDPGSPVKMLISSETESQQFKRWFVDWQNHPENASKIVNADGTPKIMYHGSSAQFTTFDKRKAKAGVFGKGFYFAPSETVAKAYGSTNVLKTYLNVRNPYIVTDSIGFTTEDYRNMQKQLGVQETITDRNVSRVLNQLGYDGIMAYNGKGNIREIVVFEPAQIKSTTDNVGTFDGSNPDIRYSISSDKDIAPVRGGIYGKDIRIEGPLREDLPEKPKPVMEAPTADQMPGAKPQTAAMVEAPVREDVQTEKPLPENFEAKAPKDGMQPVVSPIVNASKKDERKRPKKEDMSPEERAYYEETGEKTVTTFRERLREKLRNLRKEFSENEQNKQASAEQYDAKIAELQEYLDSGKQLSGKQLNRLVQQNAAAISAQNAAQAQQAEPMEAPTATVQANGQQVTKGTSKTGESGRITVTLEEASKKYGAQAQAMIHTYQAGQDIAKYNEAYLLAYDMGKNGVSQEYAKNSPAIRYLTDA